MSKPPKQIDRDRFTKVASALAVNVGELVNWGLDTGNTTPELMRWTIAARKDAAQKLIESGMSQREAAKVLGVTQMTISRDLKQNVSDSETKRVTGKPRKSKSGGGSRGGKASRAKGNGHDDDGEEAEVQAHHLSLAKSDPGLFFHYQMRAAAEAIEGARSIENDFEELHDTVKPIAADWQKLREYAREAATLWSQLAHKLESTVTPSTKRAESFLPEGIEDATERHNV